MFDSLAELRAPVAGHAAAFDPALLDATAAAAAVSEWAAIENIASTMKAMAAARVASSSTWKDTGVASPAEWLARETGTTAARAREQIATGGRLEKLGATAAAARRGDVSADQTAAIADAATADPAAEEALLGAAGQESLGELRDRCARTKAAADPDPDATRARIHRERRMRRWKSGDGTSHLHANGPADLLARLDAALRPIIDDLFANARREGRREAHEAYAFDALIELADRATTTPGEAETASPRRRATRYRAVLRIDWEALVRGGVDGDETCEIAGLGPIPVAIARQLLGESTLHLVLTKGTQVANVTHLGRGPNAAQRIALLWQQPACTRLGCPRHARLQIDHRDPYAACKVTELDNLDLLCEHDHRLKTNHGWALVEGTGKRLFVPPDHPDHPRQRQRPRPREPVTP